jgi:hypothetical protein
VLHIDPNTTCPKREAQKEKVMISVATERKLAVIFFSLVLRAETS